jgi:Lon protease-like protein
MAQLGVLEVVALGDRRFRILEGSVQGDGLARGSVEFLAPEEDSPIPAGCETCVRLLEQLVQRRGSLFEPPHRLDSSAWVSARLAEILPLPLGVKQELLENGDARARLERLNAFLAAASRE